MKSDQGPSWHPDELCTLKTLYAPVTAVFAMHSLIQVSDDVYRDSVQGQRCPGLHQDTPAHSGEASTSSGQTDETKRLQQAQF